MFVNGKIFKRLFSIGLWKASVFFLQFFLCVSQNGLHFEEIDFPPFASVLISKELVSLLPAFQFPLVKNFFSANTRNIAIHLAMLNLCPLFSYSKYLYLCPSKHGEKSSKYLIALTMCWVLFWASSADKFLTDSFIHALTSSTSTKIQT